MLRGLQKKDGGGSEQERLGETVRSGPTLKLEPKGLPVELVWTGEKDTHKNNSKVFGLS